ncbi:MAG TPA: hypothetical protein DCS93_11850 [Microscillaceae bacterium]|nr:hypothetical protein [Microscillaceae bacterium]
MYSLKLTFSIAAQLDLIIMNLLSHCASLPKCNYEISAWEISQGNIYGLQNISPTRALKLIKYLDYYSFKYQILTKVSIKEEGISFKPNDYTYVFVRKGGFVAKWIAYAKSDNQLMQAPPGLNFDY